MKYKILVAILIIAIMTSVGCIDDSDNDISTPASIFVEYPSEDDIKQYDDELYINYCITSSEILRIDMEGAALSAEYGDLENLEIWCRYIKEDSKRMLNVVKQFKVSSTLQPSKLEFELALEDYYLAGKYGEIGARDVSASDLEMAAHYTGKANDHIAKTTELLPDSL